MKTMKYMMVLVTLLCAAAVPAKSETNTTWKTEVTMVQTVKAVKLNAITIAVLPDNKVAVTVMWTWLDQTGKPVRTGSTHYSEEQIAAKLAAKGASIEQFRQLFLAIAAEEATAP